MNGERPIRAVVFDLDGTLCDSLPDIANAANTALIELGLPARTLASYRENPGDGIADLLRNAAVAAGAPQRAGLDDLTAELVRHYRVAYGQHDLKATTLFDGIAELLDRLAELGVPMAILSNKGQADVTRIAALQLNRWSFAAIVGHRSGSPKKPDPTLAIEIARTLAAAPADCLYVGDTSVDAETARSAGMIAVGVSWGFHSSDTQRAAGAERIAGHPRDIWQWYRPRLVAR